MKSLPELLDKLQSMETEKGVRCLINIYNEVFTETITKEDILINKGEITFLKLHEPYILLENFIFSLDGKDVLTFIEKVQKEKLNPSTIKLQSRLSKIWNKIWE